MLNKLDLDSIFDETSAGLAGEKLSYLLWMNVYLKQNYLTKETYLD